MDPRLKNLYDKRAMFVQQRTALLDKIITEDRAMTDQERAEQERLAGEIRRMDELLVLAQEALAAPPGELRGDGEPQPTGPEAFREFGDFLQAVRWNQADSRLVHVDPPKSSDKRALSMGVGAAGGFLVPEQFSTDVRMIDPQAAVVRPRATVIPPGDPPDAAFTLPALNQSGARGVYSGVQVTWIAEAHEKPETEPGFLDIKLEPQEVAAHVVVSDKLLRNSAAAGAIVTELLRRAINGAEDIAFLSTGTGAGQPMAIIGHPSTIPVVRTGAGAIVYADIVNMYAAHLFGGRSVWIASQSTLPQLMTMATPLGQLVWQQDARTAAPGSVLGLPVIISHRSPVLGALGDLVLVDLDYYLIKDGSGIGIAASEHPRFTRNQTIIKAWWNVDGQPWLTTPLLLEDGVSQVSPFVVLQ